jgi:hypothetical protein
MTNIHTDMKRGDARWVRVARGLGGLLALTCSVTAPLPLAVRLAAFGTTGAYLLFSAVRGRCAVTRLLQRSACREPGP